MSLDLHSSAVMAVGRARLNYFGTLEAAAVELYPNEDSGEVIGVLDQIIKGFISGDFDFELALKSNEGVAQKVFPIGVAAKILGNAGHKDRASLMYRGIGRLLAEQNLYGGWKQEEICVQAEDLQVEIHEYASLVCGVVLGSVLDIDSVYDKVVRSSLVKSSPIDFNIVGEVYANIRKKRGKYFDPSCLYEEDTIRRELQEIFPTFHDPKVANYLRRMFWVPEKRDKVNGAFASRVDWHILNPNLVFGGDGLSHLPQGHNSNTGSGLFSQHDYQRLADNAFGLAGLLLESTGADVFKAEADKAFGAYGARRTSAINDYLNLKKGPMHGFNSIVDF